MARSILVAGATGNQGGAVAERLLEEGWAVRALTRDPDKPAARALAERGAALADAAQAARVEHFVYSSVGSAERHTGLSHFESKRQIEDHIRDLGLPAT